MPYQILKGTLLDSLRDMINSCRRISEISGENYRAGTRGKNTVHVPTFGTTHFCGSSYSKPPTNQNSR